MFDKTSFLEMDGYADWSAELEYKQFVADLCGWFARGLARCATTANLRSLWAELSSGNRLGELPDYVVKDLRSQYQSAQRHLALRACGLCGRPAQTVCAGGPICAACAALGEPDPIALRRALKYWAV